MYQTILTILMMLFCFTVIYGGFCDLARFTIPNRVSYGLFLLFLVYAGMVFFNTPYFPHIGFYITPMAWNLILGAVVFVIMFVAWQLRWVGGGDVKFISAIAFWMGREYIFKYLILLLALSLAYMVVMRVVMALSPNVELSSAPAFLKNAMRKAMERVIPYGLPAALAGLIAGIPAIGSHF